MAELVLLAILLGVGGAAVGGPEALRLLIAVAGRSPAADITISFFLICAFAAIALGTLLLSRFFRDARGRNAGAAAPAPAPATERLAKLTAAVALAAMFFVTSCLLAAPAIPAGRGNAAGSARRTCFA